MKLYEIGEGKLLFVLDNKEIKTIKRSSTPLELAVVRDERRVSFSFMSKEMYEKKIASARQKLKDNTDGKKNSGPAEGE